MASYPNLNLLGNAAASPAAYISPGYQSPPAPMGLADYGVGSSAPYAYNTTHFLATTILTTPPNVTNPSSEGVIDPTGASQGYVGSVYEFGLQLNTILTNVTIPGLTNGTFWTQNVLNVNDTGIHFVDDVFNFSYLSGASISTSGPTIASGCGSTDVTPILEDYGGVYQCVGTTIPISAADYPLTIQLYNNASVNAQGMDQVTFGYQITSGAAGLLGAGISDTVVFNNPAAPTPPVNPVAFEVNGYEGTPAFDTAGHHLFYDSEIIFGGQIGGDNAMFRSMDGSLSLEYANTSTGPWQSIPAAYNFGSDTGETSAGIAGYWTANHVEEINQGPSFLYGLWNGLTRISVASGAIQFAGSVNPVYGFVFVSNIDPGTTYANLSWVPTTASGTFSTYLPPAIPAGGSAYYTAMFAAGFAEVTGSTFSTSQTGYAFPAPATSTTILAPLYMQGNAQASSLAHNVTGRSIGSTAPYVFDGLAVTLPIPFTYVNDYDYPTFAIFQAEGLTSIPVYVNNTIEGPNTGTTIWYYTQDYVSGGGWDSRPLNQYNLPYYTQQFNVFGSANARVTNEVLYGSAYYGASGTNGGVVFFFLDSGAYASDITSYDLSYGVFNGLSTGTVVQNLTAAFGANGMDDVGSTGTVGSSIAATSYYSSSSYASLGVYALDSWSATYQWVNASDYAYGYYSGSPTLISPYYELSGSHGTSLSELNATSHATGVFDTVSTHDSFTNLSSYEGATAGMAIESLGISFTNVTAYEAAAVSVDYTAYTNMTGVTWTNSNSWVTYGAVWDDSNYTSLTNAVANDFYWVVDGMYDGATTLTNVTINGAFAGIGLEYPMGVTGSELASSQSEFPFELDYGVGGTITGVTQVNGYIGFNLFQTNGVTVSNVVANDSEYISPTCYPDYCGGVAVYEGTGNTVSDVTAVNLGIGVRIDGGATGNTVSSVSAGTSSTGVYVEASDSNTVSGVSATAGSVGVYLEGSTGNAVSHVSVTDWSIGVEAYGTVGTSITQVTATNSTLSSPYVGDSGFGVPVAAVVTQDTQRVIISGVTATDYPAAYFDYGSTTPSVSQVNATGSYYALLLNGTYAGLFSGIDAYQDMVGVQFGQTAEDNVITGGAFVDDSSYGVMDASGSANTIYNNNFVGNNGATSTYSAAHIQAWSVGVDYYYSCGSPAVLTCAQGVGNYWADWHTYGPNGHLAPYPVTGVSWDYFPIGPLESFSVTFTETGLSSGAKWSVSVNGVTVSSTNSTISVPVPMGTYSYSVAASGYSASPSSGSVTVAGPNQSVAVAFSSTTSLASTSDLNTYFGVALAIAVLALVLALLALFWRRKPKPSENPPPPTAWSPPPPAETPAPPPSASGGPAPTNWSEGSGGPETGGPGSG